MREYFKELLPGSPRKECSGESSQKGRGARSWNYLGFIFIEPFVEKDRLMREESFEASFDFIEAEELVAVLAFEEARLGHLVEKDSERIVVMIHVEEGARFLVEAQLEPDEDLDDLFQSSGSSGKGDKGIGKVGHSFFACMHRIDDVKPAQPGVRDFLVGKVPGDDANNLSATF